MQNSAGKHKTTKTNFNTYLSANVLPPPHLACRDLFTLDNLLHIYCIYYVILKDTTELSVLVVHISQEKSQTEKAERRERVAGRVSLFLSGSQCEEAVNDLSLRK